MGENITNKDIIEYFINSFSEGGHYDRQLHSGTQLDTEADEAVTFYRMHVDITRAKQQLQWQPTVELRQGLIHTIEYFSELMKEDPTL